MPAIKSMRDHLKFEFNRSSFKCQDEEKGSQFLGAAKAGDASQVTEMLQQLDSVKVTWRDEIGYTALHWAALYGHLEVRWATGHHH